MVFEFILPDVGEGIHEAEVLAIKVKEGEQVKEYQPIFDVETDKAVVEITSPVAGVINRIFVKVGDMAKVGTVMITFNTDAQVAAEPARAAAAAAAYTPSAVAEVQEALAVQADRTAAQFEPAAMAVAAPAGTDPATPARSALATPAGSAAAVVPAAPATRRLARELGVDIGLVRGSGPAGRITKEDIRAFAEGVPAATAEPGLRRAQTGAPLPNGEYGKGVAAPREAVSREGLSRESISERAFELPDFTRFGPIERVPLRSLRRKIAINMAQSWNFVPHVAHFDEIDITDMENYRARHEDAVLQRGGRLTLTVLVLKALASGLKKYPQFNSSLDESTNEVIYKRYYNIGVAVATERGLIVPVIRDVDKKNLVDLSVELFDIAQKTRSGKIELERLQGGTFTLTNIGAIGGTGMMPMVNHPEVAIFGIARSKLQPVVRGGQVVIRNILNVTLAFDHRVADGAEAAYFVKHVSDCLEDPFKLLLEA
jgi:pyruvate dehydrogenase E2 component (dihydrolipoamide acetyltransferase)